ncbi:hypothetical protein [Paraburkholderia sp. J12]|uniref:hypothetical protein n=1 Tax=Paraburkholderia sp. J12 TaxID=2805432 RepID=UPI002ABE0E4B|nr:hypothetical protein [Paraburkholderia sp. J12]
MSPGSLGAIPIFTDPIQPVNDKTSLDWCARPFTCKHHSVEAGGSRMQIELSKDQYGVVPTPSQEHGVTVEHDGSMDVRVLLSHMRVTTNGTGRQNAPECWEAALRELGHVSIFAFATGEFMLIGPEGERVRAESLGVALQDMLRRRRSRGSGRDESD